MITLYQFPISHFCEKARWALDYKNIPHEKINLIPGLHTKVTLKLSRRSSVPLLHCDTHLISNSADIIDYVDSQYADKQLTPADLQDAQKAKEWEKVLDKEVGINARLCAYHILLEHPATVKKLFTQKGPWYGPLFLTFAYTKLVSKMRKLMNINNNTYVASKQALHNIADKLALHYQSHKYLVGNEFSRADLTAAALFAPLMMPDKYGLDWPEPIPEDFQSLIDEFKEKLFWLSRLYEEHR